MNRRRRQTSVTFKPSFRRRTFQQSILTILPNVEDLIQAAVLHTPVANQLRVGSAQVNLLIGQFDESSKLVWTDAVGAEFIKGSVFLLGAGGEVCVRL